MSCSMFPRLTNYQSIYEWIKMNYQIIKNKNKNKNEGRVKKRVRVLFPFNSLGVAKAKESKFTLFVSIPSLHFLNMI